MIHLYARSRGEDEPADRARRHRAAVAERWATVEVAEYVEGAGTARPARRRMIENLQAGDIVVSGALGELCSGFPDLEHAARTWLSQVTLVLLEDGVDTAGTTAALRFTDAVALIRSLLRSRQLEAQRAGIAAARARHQGRCPWGGGGGRIALNPRELLALQRKGLSVRAIARRMAARGVSVSPTTIHKRLVEARGDSVFP